MPSRIFRSSISPFYDTLSCVCDLLFSVLGFLLQLLAEPRFQNAFLYTTIRRFLTDSAISTWRSLNFGRTCVCCTTELRELVAGRLPDLLCSSSLPAVGHALLCLVLAMLFFACCWPCSSYVDSSDRLARVIRACCLLSRNGFAVRLLRLYLWAVLQIAMPTLCSSCATGCSLLPPRVIRACFLLTRIRSSG